MSFDYTIDPEHSLVDNKLTFNAYCKLCPSDVMRTYGGKTAALNNWGLFVEVQLDDGETLDKLSGKTKKAINNQMKGHPLMCIVCMMW